MRKRFWLWTLTLPNVNSAKNTNRFIVGSRFFTFIVVESTWIASQECNLKPSALGV